MRSSVALVFILILTASSLILVRPTLAQTSTPVIGILQSDTTWTKANSPYSLTGPVAVINGVTLTIEAGATVNLNSYYIQVNGTLVARGSETDNIHFNGGYIGFTSLSFGCCIIENTIIDTELWGNNASPEVNNNSINRQINFHGEGGAPIVSNNVVKNTNINAEGSAVIVYNNVTGGGISSGSDHSQIAYNIISNARIGISGDGQIFGNVIFNCEKGIRARVGSTIERNLIYNNTYGIYTQYLVTNTIRYNTIANNTYGCYGHVASSITYNDIFNNTKNSFYLTLAELSVGVQAYDIDAANNWWGTTDTQAIAQTIHDNKNDFNLGTVTFAPFLTAPNPQAPTLPNTNPSPTPTLSPTPTQTNTPTPSPTITTSPSQPNTQSISPTEFYTVISVLVAAIVALAATLAVFARKLKKNNLAGTKQ